MVFKPQDVKIDRRTGLVKSTHGISVDSDSHRVADFGGAYLIGSMPDELSIIQRGRRDTHYEIVPSEPVTPEKYQELLDQIDLVLYQKGS